jgi:hypothetical protein
MPAPQFAYNPALMQQYEGGGLQKPTIDPIDILSGLLGNGLQSLARPAASIVESDAIDPTAQLLESIRPPTRPTQAFSTFENAQLGKLLSSPKVESLNPEGGALYSSATQRALDEVRQAIARAQNYKPNELPADIFHDSMDMAGKFRQRGLSQLALGAENLASKAARFRGLLGDDDHVDLLNQWDRMREIANRVMTSKLTAVPK